MGFRCETSLLPLKILCEQLLNSYHPHFTPFMSSTPTTASPIPLQAEPGHLIRRAHQLAVGTFAKTHGKQITPVQYAILRALEDTPGIDQVTLAYRVALDTSTTADIAARLDAKGWIVRELLPRRQRALRLTPEGEAVLADMLPRVAPMYAQLLDALEPTERDEFLRLLRKFVHLNTPAPEAQDNPPAHAPDSAANQPSE
jgi:DNA-binding MarR family transcriptional regulator